MTSVWLIARRELHSFLLSPLGYIIVAAVLFLHGLWFNTVVMQGEQRSSEVLEAFFFHSSGFVAVVAVLLSMRLFAEEKQTGTIVLLQTSPATEWEVVLGKFAGALLFLCGYLALTGFMPLLVAVNGKVSGGHLFAGYFGLVLLGGAVLAVGALASSLVKSQLLAAVLGGVMVMALFAAWMIARKVEGDLGAVVGYLDLMDKHYRSFSRGVLKSSTIIYYLSLTYAALLGAVSVLSARRWRG
jgi:ABC-2 type transport system permease protein